MNNSVPLANAPTSPLFVWSNRVTRYKQAPPLDTQGSACAKRLEHACLTTNAPKQRQQRSKVHTNRFNDAHMRVAVEPKLPFNLHSVEVLLGENGAGRAGLPR